MTEPDVTLTDIGLAIECGIFALLIARRWPPATPLSLWFAVFFASIGVAALGRQLLPDVSPLGHTPPGRGLLPAVRRLPAAQAEYDPDERFQSDWYRHYRAMFADAL